MNRTILLILQITAVLLTSSVNAAVYTVPGDYPTIQGAIDGAPSGSSIEVAPGTYTEYITVLDLNKDLYLRATEGAAVTVIDGGGSQKLLYVANGPNGDSNQNVVFDGFTFANGRETGVSQSPITIANAKTVFLNCIMENNRAAEKGGAVLIFGNASHPKFLGCTFRNNFSEQTGGAVLANGEQALVTFKECLFENNSNRWNDSSAADNGGGAVYFGEAGGYILDSVFRNNSCSYAGGAVTSISSFDGPGDFIYIEGCLFDSNFADPLPGQTAPGNTEAGAVFGEANVHLELYRCYFTNNWAEGGGAVQSYRAHLTVRDSVFVDNRAEGGLGTGGAISVGLDDAGDADRREAMCVISNVLIRACTGHAGGGIYHAGDQYHGHQGTITLHRVVIEDCESIQSGPSDGHGGGMYLQKSYCEADELYLLNNTADQGGGAITLVLDTDITGQNSFIVGNQGNGGNNAIYDPYNNNPTWINTYFGHNPPGSGGSTTSWFDSILDYTLRGSSYFVYGVIPDSGSPHVDPGSMSLPDDGDYRAGSLTVTGAGSNTTYSLVSDQPELNTDVDYTVGNPGAPFPAPIPSVPGLLEAEDYDLGGEGFAYHDSSIGNAGATYRTGDNVEIASSGSAGNGYLVGWIVAGEWLQYTFNADVAGTYDLTLRTAAPAEGGKLYLELDGQMVGDVQDVPDTGGWESWGNLNAGEIYLSEGWHKLRVVIAAAGFNFDQIDISLQTTNPVLSVAPSSLSISAKEGVAPPSQSFQVWNSGAGTLNYQIETNVSWLSVSPTSGSSGGERDTITVQADTSGMTTGTYNGVISVISDATNGTENIGVTLTIREGKLNPIDFDGDGRADIAVYRPSDNVWRILRSSDGTVQNYEWGLLASDLPVAGDYDGDGFADPAAYQQNGTWHLARSSAGYAGLQLGTPGVINVPADYDGDGATDMAIYEPWSGVWHLSQSTDGYYGIGWGGSGDIPVPADYDGDGIADIGVYRPSNQTWYLICSSDGVKVEEWGLLSTDKPVPADYDGDGTDDLAVYQANGTWHLARSSAGYAGLQLGGPNDIPVPADYDGDGADDMAIFEPHGVWHLSQTTDGYRGVVLGQTGDLPVKVDPRY